MAGNLVGKTTAHGLWAVATDLRQEPSTCPSPSLPHLTPVRAPTSRQGTGCVTAGADAATTGRSERANSSPGRSPSGLIDRSPASTAGPPRLRRRFPASIRSGAPLKSTHRRAARRKRVRRNRTGRAPSGAASTTPRPGPGTSGASTRRGGRPGRHRPRRHPGGRVRRQGLRGPGGAGSADRRGGQCPLLAASFRAHARRARVGACAFAVPHPARRHRRRMRSHRRRSRRSMNGERPSAAVADNGRMRSARRAARAGHWPIRRGRTA